MTRYLRRVAAAALSLSLTAGPAALCAAMLPTPEARMACCANGGECPMHRAGSHHPGSHAGSHHQPTQPQADHCCTVSERDRSAPTMPIAVGAPSVAALGPSVVLPMAVPTLVRTDAWRTTAPIPLASVSRHVLLTVFLV